MSVQMKYDLAYALTIMLTLTLVRTTTSKFQKLTVVLKNCSKNIFLSLSMQNIVLPTNCPADQNVNLFLFSILFILFLSLSSEKDYKQVPKVDCGTKKQHQKYNPVIFNANDCFANLEFSSAYKNVNLFDAAVNASAWTLPQSKGASVCHFNLILFWDQN